MEPQVGIHITVGESNGGVVGALAAAAAAAAGLLGIRGNTEGSGHDRPAAPAAAGTQPSAGAQAPPQRDIFYGTDANPGPFVRRPPQASYQETLSPPALPPPSDRAIRIGQSNRELKSERQRVIQEAEQKQAVAAAAHTQRSQAFAEACQRSEQVRGLAPPVLPASHAAAIDDLIGFLENEILADPAGQQPSTGSPRLRLAHSASERAAQRLEHFETAQPERRACLRFADAFLAKAGQAQRQGAEVMSQELLAGAEALLEDVYGYTAGAVTLGSNFLAGAIHGISGIPLSPFPGMERPFAVGQALGSSLGLAADAATLGASIAGLGGSGAAAVTSLGTLAPVAVPIAELSLAAATASAAAAGGHLEALQSSGRMYMSADGPHKKGPTRAQAAQGGSKNPATFDEAYAKAHAKAAETPHIYSQETLDALGHVNPAHERYLVGLRRHMEAPPVQDESLRAILRSLYKPNAAVGNGSTGAAWRVEQTTRTQVGGRWHGEALVNRCKPLIEWLTNNPHAADSDIQTAKNVLSAHIEAFISP